MLAKTERELLGSLGGRAGYGNAEDQVVVLDRARDRAERVGRHPGRGRGYRVSSGDVVGPACCAGRRARRPRVEPAQSRPRPQVCAELRWQAVRTLEIRN